MLATSYPRVLLSLVLSLGVGPALSQETANTPPDTVTLQAADVERLLAEREETGFGDIGSTFSSLVTPAVLNQLEDATNFFQLKVIVRIDTVRITYFSILERGPRGDVTPILRSLGAT